MIEHGVNVDDVMFLQKPVSPTTLANTVRALLDGVALEPDVTPAHAS